MNLLLILREELLCLIILLFLVMTSRLYRVGKDRGSFFRLSVYGLGHVIFDIITVYSVNNPEIVSPAVNYGAHVLFYLFAILYTRELMLYVVRLAGLEHMVGRFGAASIVIVVGYVAALPVLPMIFLQGNGTMYSYGMAAYIGYAIAFLFIFVCLILITRYYGRLSEHVRRTLVPMLAIVSAAEIVQIAMPELLFTGGSVTIATVGLFFGLENPSAFFQHKALLDALTGVKSRNTYEFEMKEMEEDYQKGRYDRSPVGLVFCDLNGLKKVNDTFGHLRGDEYIGAVAQTLMEKLASARNIYRMGGDEFLAVYMGVSSAVIQAELEKVRAACRIRSRDYPFTIEVAMGFAMSGEEYTSLREVLRAADHNMYSEKWRMKNTYRLPEQAAASGDGLDKSGLDSRIFDAFACTADRNYIYVCNVQTNVSRWSRAAVEYFGLPGEYMLDAGTIWEEYVHPEDREAYRTDLDLVFSGKKKRHDMEYRARNKEGSYVICTCRGTILEGKDGEPDLFAGTMINHGIMDGIDPVTSLHNQREYTRCVRRLFETETAGTVLLVGLNSFGRINVIYGSAFGDKVLRMFGARLKKLVSGNGHVFRTEGVKFALCLKELDRGRIEALYEELKRIAEKEIFLDAVQVPLSLSGGAVLVNNWNVSERWIVHGAEFALERSKQERHGALVYWGAPVQKDDERKLELYARLSQSIVKDYEGYFLCYQPIIDARKQQIVAMEALLRWQSEEFGVVLPGEFILWLESDPGFISLGRWILRQAIQDAKPFLAQDPNFQVNVNITAGQLAYAGFEEEVSALLKEFSYPAHALCLELTERCRGLDYGILKEKIGFLRAQGIHVAMDDLGNGSASMGLMLELPLDMIKIDLSLIRGIAGKPVQQLFVESIIRAGKKLSIQSCLEGVEEPEDYEYLKTTEADCYQGYYFGGPLEIRALRRLYDGQKDAPSYIEASQEKKREETE